MFYMETMYKLHLRVRYAHDVLYEKNRFYKNYSDKPWSSKVHKATVWAFIVSFTVFTFLQYVAPNIFNLAGPEKALASSIQKIWTTLADFTNNNGATGNITSTNTNLNGGDPQLSTTPGATTENTTAQFGGHTKSNTAGGTNNVYLLKPNGATATNVYECNSAFIVGGLCAADPFNGNSYSGRTGSVLAGKLVFNRDIAATDKYVNGNTIGTATPQWKTTNTSCASPQCTTAGPVAETQSGYTGTNGLVADNAVDFALSTSPPTYPARDACKALGGRLPTIAELMEMYNYKSTYGNNFQSNIYWSSTEYNSANASPVNLNIGGIANNTKSYTYYYTRCVR